MSLLQNISKKIKSVSWAGVCVYGGLVVGALLIWWSLNVPAVVEGDARGYLEYAQALINGQYETLLSTFRPYGYPLFLAILIKISTFFNLPSFYPMIFASQFMLHIASAALATLMMRRFLPQPRAWTLYLVFAAVAWNPYLLAMGTQILSETLSVFFITLFFYYLQSDLLNSRTITRCLMGVALGLASLARPLNLVWGVGVIGLLGLAALWEIRRQNDQSYKALAKRLGQIAICFTLVAATQQLSVTFYKLNAKNIPKVDNLRSSLGVLYTHVKSAPYTYRYETLYTQGEVSAVWYINARLKPSIFKPEVLLMPFVKLAALFQQHDYQVYRPLFGIVSPTAFGVGLVYWIMFCYVVLQAVRDMWQAWKEHKPFPVSGLLTMIMVSFAALYAIFTIPEPRYLFSIYPVLMPLFAYYALRPSRWWHFILPLGVAIITYGLTAHTLLWALENAV